MSTKAEQILRPTDSNTFRTAFLYVGQGESTLHVIPDGGSFKYVLIDINRPAKLRGVDVVRLLEDLLPNVDGKPTLDVFVNTHPHNDHLCGLDELRKRIRVKEVWHTGFTPSDRHADAYSQLQGLIEDVQKAGGGVIEYRGTRDEKVIGDVAYNVLSPADHTKDEVDSLEGEERDCRIHDYCGVLRFGYGSNRRHVMITGDADKVAWKDYILGSSEYHAERLPSNILSAVHHGSRSFFKLNEDDVDPYTRHIELMAPSWLIISSPAQRDSPHGHPHDDALEIYEEYVPPDHTFILGETPCCVIYDITQSGDELIDTDEGDLIAAYPTGGDDDDGNTSGKKVEAAYVITRLDSGRPMGSHC